MSGRVSAAVGASDSPAPWGLAAQDVLPFPDRHPGYVGYVGLLFFTLVIITYYLPGADVGAAVAAGSVLLGLLIGYLRFRWGLEATALVAVLALAILSLHDPLDPVWATQRTWELAKITLVFVASIHLLNSGRRVAGYATIWFGLFVLFPARGTLVNYARGYQIGGRGLWNNVWENPNDLAAGALVTAAVGGALLYVIRRGPVRIGIVAGLALIGAVIILSGSRGVFLGTVGAALMLAWHTRRKVKVLVTLGCVLLLGLVAAPQPIRERLATLGQLSDPEAMRTADAGSVKERLTLWKTAFAIIGDYPILGIGVGAFPMANQQYARDLAHDGSVFGRAGAPRQDAHSTYLTVWTELGTVGLLAYCALLGATWHRLHAVRRRWGRIAPRECAALGVLQAGLVGYLVACLWASYSVLTLPYLYFALIFAWATAVDEWGRARYRLAALPPTSYEVGP